jgi:hypothetical protein
MTVLAEVKVVTADECGCDFTATPVFHDKLLGIEDMDVIYETRTQEGSGAHLTIRTILDGSSLSTTGRIR